MSPGAKISVCTQWLWLKLFFKNNIGTKMTYSTELARATTIERMANINKDF